MRNPLRRRWAIVALWPDGDRTPDVDQPRFWTARGARKFREFAQEACNRKAHTRGIKSPTLEVHYRA